MKSFLMRHAGETEEGRVIGLVVAHDIDELWDIVDEWGNPNSYEYAKVRDAGGLFFGFRDQPGMPSEQWIAQLPSEEFPPEPGEKTAKWKKFSELLKQPFDEWYAARYARVLTGR